MRPSSKVIFLIYIPIEFFNNSSILIILYIIKKLYNRVPNILHSNRFLYDENFR